MPRNTGTAPVAIVTGGSRGLGRLVAGELARRKFTVITCSTGEQGPGVGEALHLKADITDPAAVDRLVEAAVSGWGRIDVVVNNAGYAPASSPIPETADEVVRRCFETNVLGAYYVLRRVLPPMFGRSGGGVVINIASRAGLRPVPGQAAYSASKSALISLTLAAAKEDPEGRVLCVSVCPGGLNTEMRASIYGSEDARGQLDPRQVAELVAELATARTASGRAVISGAAILVTKEGGVSIVEWPVDERGRGSVFFADAAKR